MPNHFLFFPQVKLNHIDPERNIFLFLRTVLSQTRIIVLDHGSWDRDVVLVRRTISWGNPGVGREIGMGREWGGNGEGEVSLRATWGQGGRDRITQRRVSKYISRREWKGELTRNQQGE
jgi:hypothetical protein